MGQRVAKHIYTSADVWEKSTYYVRDAQGNVLATYDKVDEDTTLSYKLTERDIYGSLRLGLNTKDVEMIGAVVDTTNSYHQLGYKQYEVSNHLGNVLAVITDKKYPHDLGDYDSDNDSTNESYVSGTLDGIVDLYTADLVLSRDYSPFGVTLDGRSFNRQECDTLTVIDTVASVDNTWPTSSVDDWVKIDASNTVAVVSGELRSTRSGAGTLGMYKVATLEHADYIIVKARMRRNTATGTTYDRLRLVDSTGALIWKDSVVITTTNTNYSSSIGFLNAGVYRLEVERRNTTATQLFLDNVLLAYADTNTVIDCDGGRKDYRYAFNGMEHDDEVKGEGNSYTTFFRQNDPRLGRWLSIDPKVKAFESPYISMGNTPIIANDPLGDDMKISRKAFKEVKNDLSVITGLKLRRSFFGKLKYDDYKAGTAENKRPGSQAARNDLMAMIDSPRKVTVELDPNSPSGYTPNTPGSGSPFDGVLNLNMSEIKTLQTNITNDLKKQTVGPGMVMMHELGHWFNGTQDIPTIFGVVNPAASSMQGQQVPRDNLYRNQLQAKERKSLRWGVRQAYYIEWNGIKFIPMDWNTRTALITGNAAYLSNHAASYIWFPSGPNQDGQTDYNPGYTPPILPKNGSFTPNW